MKRTSVGAAVTASVLALVGCSPEATTEVKALKPSAVVPSSTPTTETPSFSQSTPTVNPQATMDATFLRMVVTHTRLDDQFSAEQLLLQGEGACVTFDNGGSVLDATEEVPTAGAFSTDAMTLVIAAANTLCPEHADAPSGP
jgi:hypothetical protein